MAVKADCQLYIQSADQSSESALMELVRVCQAGDVPLLRTLLSDKKTAATLSQRIGENLTTVLHEACRSGHSNCVRPLLDKHVDAKITNKRGFAPIHVAAYYGHMEVIRRLLDYGACKVDFPSLKGETALQLASIRGHMSLVDHLVHRGALVAAQDIDCNTALHYAAASSCSGVMERLLTQQEARECIDRANTQGQSPLHRAAELGCVTTLNVLLEHHADPTTKDNHQCTPLQLAELAGNTECTVHLLNAVGGNGAVAGP